MKKFNIAIFFLALAVLFSCQPEDIKPLGDPLDKKQAVVGQWQISQVIQQDELSAIKGFPDFVTRMDITTIFPEAPYTDLKVSFNEDGTFAVDAGRALVDLPAAGTWALDNPDYPSAVVLTDKEGNVTSVEFGDFNGLTQGTLNLALLRRDENGKAFLSYQYTFEKQ
jgi:hypothetical protein